MTTEQITMSYKVHNVTNFETVYLNIYKAGEDVTSYFTISYDDANKNICGYRFSIVSSNGLPKSGTQVANIYLCDLTIGSNAYFGFLPPKS